MVTSDTESFTAGGKTYRRQYWLIGMESTCKPELAFHAKTAPLLIVLRGLHMEVEHKSALAVEILAVREWVREYGLDEPDYCVIVDQDWHAAKVHHGTGKIVPLKRGDPDYYFKASKTSSSVRERGFTVERRSENVFKVVYTGGSSSDSGYRRLKALFTEEYNMSGPYVNIAGFRMERFLSFDQMHANGQHVTEVDTPHITVLENTTEHMLAKDIAEELLLQNWNVLPNAVNIFYEPRATLPWITKGARLVIVWRHYSEIEPDPESAAYKDYVSKTTTELEISGTSAKYSSVKLGGIICRDMIETRTRFAEIGARYRKHSAHTSTEPVTPTSSPARKKTKGGRTPERALVAIKRTPQSGSSASSITVRSSVDSIERRTAQEDERLTTALSQLSFLASEVIQIRAQRETDMSARQVERATDKREQQEQRTSDLRSVQAQFTVLEDKLQKVATAVASAALKSKLSKIKTVANQCISTQRRIALYREQLSNAISGERKDTLHDQLQHTELDFMDRRTALEDLRIEAHELAEEDGVSLSAEQLRSDVE